MEDTQDNMLALSKLIRAYANKTNKDPRKEDYISTMLFG